MKGTLLMIAVDVVIRLISLAVFSAVVMYGLSILNISVTYTDTIVVMVLLKVLSLWVTQDFRRTIEDAQHRNG